MSYRDEQRLAFGAVAELYDRARPSYPEPVIDALLNEIAASGDGIVLEVGAGTGKATILLAERGLDVVALEPDPRMADVARGVCGGFPGVTVETTDFEHWSGRGPARAIVSAQAWHWVDPATRLDLAAAVLTEGGLLAAMWTLPEWEAIELRDELREVYERRVPALAPEFPMHPASRPTTIAGAWREEIEASSGLTSPETIEHIWQEHYSPRAYTEMVSTHQDHVLLDADTKSELMSDIERTIAEGGGSIALTYCTRLCLARREQSGDVAA